MKKLYLFIIVIIICATGSWYYWYQQQLAQTLPEGIVKSNGRLELERFDIASLYPGRVEEILVEEGDEVEKNQLLVKLSSRQSSSQLTAALAAEQRAKELVLQAQAGKQQAEQTVARAEAEIKAYLEKQKVAKLELDNAQKMRQDKLISAAELSKRQAAYDAATATIEAAKAAKAEAQAASTRVAAQIAEARAGVNQAQAQVEAATSVNEDMLIRSPKAARVEYKIVEVGNVIAAGNKVVSLLDSEDVFMHIFLPNAQVSGLQVGDEARIVLDGLDMVWPAEISFIASQAQFTPKSVETQNEREKLMFKVKLKIPADIAGQYKGSLKGGMSGNGYVRRHHDITWPEALNIKLPKQQTNQNDSHAY